MRFDIPSEPQPTTSDTVILVVISWRTKSDQTNISLRPECYLGTFVEFLRYLLDRLWIAVDGTFELPC